jgi:hypothetical protein
MSRRRQRIPGTTKRKTLYVLTGIRDDEPVEPKDALAVRTTPARLRASARPAASPA